MVEHKVAALDVGLNLFKASVGASRSQVRHRQLARTAHIDATDQNNEAGHRVGFVHPGSNIKVSLLVACYMAVAGSLGARRS